MKKTFYLLGLLFFLSASGGAFGQGSANQQLARSKAQEAVKLMDDGKLAESIKLLEEACKLDADNYHYSYELALAYYLQKDYATAIKLLEPLTKRKDAEEVTFQLLGNSYDYSDKSQKAMTVSEDGLKKFPASGKMYLELGNVKLQQKEYDKAISYYEKGIEVAPQFPSNYYRAAKLYCSSTEEMWGMIYGELFMNLERNSKRTAEISKLLFDTYKSEIKFTAASATESSASVSFSKSMVLRVGADGNSMKLPFSMAYEPTLMLAVVPEKAIDIHSLDRIRTRFVESYFTQKRNKDYPNILFDYQQRLQQAGHLEAYNHWLLMKGDEDGFESWHKSNGGKWEAFTKWFGENQLVLDTQHRFYQGQYH